MSSVKPITPPSLPIPPDDYSTQFQTLLNSVLQQFGARAATAVNSLLTATTPQTLPYSAVLTFPSAATVTYRVNLTGNITLTPPQTANDGDTVTLWLLAGSAVRTITIGNKSSGTPSIIVPTGVAPTTIAANKKAVYSLRYDGVLNGGQWELTAYQNGY